MQTQNGPCFALAVLSSYDLLVVRLAEECQRGAIDASTRFHDVRHEFLLGFLVEILERFAAMFDVSRKVVVGPIRDAFEFAHSEREFVFEIVGLLRVERALLFRDVVDMDFCAGNADIFVKPEAFLKPLIG